MTKYILLFRGINVGGKNRLAMKDLKQTLIANGFQDVDTYIQSGNIVLSADENPKQTVKHLVHEVFSLDIDVFCLTEKEFSQITLLNPYKDKPGNHAHCYFCDDAIELNQVKVEKYQSDAEEITVKDNVLFLYAPDGVGRSKLVANIEACLGQQGTGRNLNTLNKLTQIIAQ